MKSPVWSDWRRVAGWNPSPAVLRETLDGGQSFRWYHAEGVWTGLWSDHVVQLRWTGRAPEWRSPDPSTSPALRRYLGLDTDWSALTDSLPWRSDAHLARCLGEFPGLRILRQPFGETLLGFLCSATKQIVQIKQMVALLAERHGSPLPALSPLDPGALALGRHRLPTWEQLARVPEQELRACLLGFRARYIAGTARNVIGREPANCTEQELAKVLGCLLRRVGVLRTKRLALVKPPGDEPF